MPATFSVRNFVHSVYVDRKHARAEKKAEKRAEREQKATPPALVDRVNLSRQVLVRPS